jgi:membrane fusion protein, multidrug efflux system
MFGSVKVDSGAPTRYLTLPQTAITFNPYGDTVFIVKPADKANAKDAKGGKDAKEGDNKDAKDKGAPPAGPSIVAQQVFVTTGSTRGDQVAILKGIEPGTEVVTSGQVKLKNGTPLVINNSVSPTDSPNPTPQER